MVPDYVVRDVPLILSKLLGQLTSNGQPPHIPSGFFSPYCSEAFCRVVGQESSAVFLRRWLAQSRIGTQTSDIAIFAVSCLVPSANLLLAHIYSQSASDMVQFQLHLLQQIEICKEKTSKDISLCLLSSDCLWLHKPSDNVKKNASKYYLRQYVPLKICLEEQKGSGRAKKTPTTKHQTSQERILF